MIASNGFAGIILRKIDRLSAPGAGCVCVVVRYYLNDDEVWKRDEWYSMRERNGWRSNGVGCRLVFFICIHSPKEVAYCSIWKLHIYIEYRKEPGADIMNRCDTCNSKTESMFHPDNEYGTDLPTIW